MSMTSMSGSNNVVVIGGGAAGMMAAGTAASLGAQPGEIVFTAQLR